MLLKAVNKILRDNTFFDLRTAVNNLSENNNSLADGSASINISGVTTSTVTSTLVTAETIEGTNLKGDLVGDVTGDVVGNLVGDVTGDVSGTSNAWDSPISISITGDVSGSVSFDGSETSTITTEVNFVDNLDDLYLSSQGGTLSGDLTVTGDLVVSGTTTTVDTSTISLQDPVITLAKDTDAADGKFRGVEFKYHNGVGLRTGFMGFDTTNNEFKLLEQATNQSEVFSGTQATLNANVTTFGSLAHTAYPKLASTNTFTAANEFTDIEVTGKATISGTAVLNDVIETFNSGSDTSGIINVLIKNDAIILKNTAQTANRQINLIGDSSSTFNSYLDIGEAASFNVMIRNGATAFFVNEFKIDNVVVAPNYVDGTPTAGNPNAIDSYSYTVLKIADAQYVVLGSISSFENN